MSIKIEVINEAVTRIKKRLAEIDEILNATPLLDIINGRKQAQEILEDNKGDYAKISELIDPIAKKEKEAFAMAEKQKDSTIGLIDEKVKLQGELGEMRNELFLSTRNLVQI